MYECKNCGGKLRFSIEEQKLVCISCGSQEAPEDYVSNTDADAVQYMDVRTYHCPRCAGELIYEDTEAVVFCPYCDSSTVLSDKLTKIAKPRYIIPFGITKEECKDEYVKMMKKAVYAPSELKSREHIDSFRGIYMPYWYYAFDIEGKASMSEAKLFTVWTSHRVEVEYKAEMKGFYQDASSSFADELSDAIKPFDTALKKDFSPAYLSGFYADCPDTVPEIYTGRLRSIVEEVVDTKVRNVEVFSKYQSEYLDTGVNAAIQLQKPQVAMLPVWFLSYKKGERIAYATINGQTGRLSMDVPVDYKKFFIGTSIAFVFLYLLLNLFLVVKPTILILITALLAVIVLGVFKWEVAKLLVHEKSSDDAGVQYVIKKKDKNKPKSKWKEDEELETLMTAVQEHDKDSKINILNVVINIILGAGLLFRCITLLSRGTPGAFLNPLVLIACLIMGSVVFTKSVKINRHLRKGYGHIVAFLALLTVIVISLINPVDDIYYYIGAFASLAAVVISLVDLIRLYNLLSTRPLPQFKRTGGDDNA
ncbi:MAG: hypothetical protein IKJ39_09775 [Lachnospiraceae bacterium]|nr:hypothetical protein [Lachnospiraceae bacterium]